MGEAMANETADTGRKVSWWRRIDGRAPGCHEHCPCFLPRPQQLFQEKRIAFALFPEPLTEQVIDRSARQVWDQFNYICLRQWLKRECHHLPVPGEFQDAAFQRRMIGQFSGTISAQDTQSGGRLMLSQVAQQVESGCIGPM